MRVYDERATVRRMIAGRGRLLPFLVVAVVSSLFDRRSGSASASAEAVRERTRSMVCVRAVVPTGNLVASGFVIAPGNRVVTTAHGLEQVESLQLVTSDGREIAATVLRRDEKADLALLAIADVELPSVLLGSVDGLAPGDAVTTIGCPLGLEFSVSRGVVSALRKTEHGYPLIQTDVPVNPGSSGGALLDEQGRVVGIIKAAVAGADRIHFALPVELARRLVASVNRDEQVRERFARARRETDLGRKIERYREVVTLAPESVEAHHNLALALERAGRTKEAEKQYREVLRLQPETESAALNLGALLHRDERYADAIAIYRAALVRVAGSLRLRNNLAEALRASGRVPDAQREFEAILATDPSYAPAHYGLALLFEVELGDPKQAAAHYRRYLALAPEADDAESVRTRLTRLEGSKPRDGDKR